MIAFVYAGQGSQKVGMGRDFYQFHPIFKTIFDWIEVDFNLKKLCFEGPEDQLAQTRYTQPCLLAFAIGVTQLLRREGIWPQAVAGLSLGEYSALTAAGVLSPEEAVQTVVLRGRVMEEAAAGLDCGMTAVLGLAREKLQEACAQASRLGTVQICNYNCPGQLVIGGEKAAVDRAGELARAQGARCRPLKVSGPFHTSLMKPAGDALAEHFRTITFHPMELPVYFNCLGDVMGPEDTVPALLERQVQSSVCWEDTIRALARDGVDTVVEIGPGKTLSSFFKKTAPQIQTYHIDTVEDFQSVVSVLKGESL